MTLSFSTHFKNGKRTNFVEKIRAAVYADRWLDMGFIKGLTDTFPLDESIYVFNRKKMYDKKLHTIRKDKSNRWLPGTLIHFVIHNRTKKRFQFSPVVPCVSVQSIVIKNFFNDKHSVIIDGRMLSDNEIITLALNDGFDTVQDFWEYFTEADFKGKLIHWTSLTY